jgi:gamma-tubulin complex component 5
MKAEVIASRDVETMAEVHRGFVSTLQIRCLLSKNLAPIHSTVIAILDLVVRFYDVCVEEAKNRSFKLPSTVSVRRRRKRKSLAAAPAPAEESSSSSGTEEELAPADYDADSEPVVSGIESPQEMLTEFDRHCSFILTGLRGVSRVGGEESWSVLADRLDWKSFSRRRT